MIRPFLFAWQFLTAIPLSRHQHDPTSAELARSMRWYTIVGFLLGGLLVLGDWLLSQILARHVVDALLILLLVLSTRGLHQDGLADTMDGLLGGQTPDERLAIMRDGRIGAFGATSLIIALGLRYAGLGALPETERWAVLLCMPALGRWAMVVGAKSAPYARKDGGLAEPFLSQLSVADLIWAAIPLIAVLSWACGLSAAVITLASVTVIAVGFAVLCTRQCRGITGDTLGATNEFAEVAFVLFAPPLLRML